ncbi:MAG: hypothetical protein EGQ76_08465 [Sutterella sp.]|jgi:hypothetical protein|uniref:hypothetical protein n=1 Tax=Duodenibacillus massiliensis TaxID=1852381 RepID=UPI000EC7C9B3|nr:hypothetical protein [uncultured Duodenibacillus sp.]MBE5702480.1 hypothetical protein [Sutterella sp.]DAJ55539.1 MAG TPA: hypothetical protein [Caudoviricetes sp.]HAF65295.1 hypothetical protein [Sutterella sp.]
MRTVNETIEWIIFESDDPETWPSDEDDKNQFYLVRPSGHENFVVTATFNRQECRFNILGKLSYGALWAKWKPLDDLLKVD